MKKYYGIIIVQRSSEKALEQELKILISLPKKKKHILLKSKVEIDEEIKMCSAHLPSVWTNLILKYKFCQHVCTTTGISHQPFKFLLNWREKKIKGHMKGISTTSLSYISMH